MAPLPSPPPRPPPPVPKPRKAHMRNYQISVPSQDRETINDNQQPAVSNGVHVNTDEAPPPPSMPTLESVTDIIVANIPSLAGIAATIGGSNSTPVVPSAPPPPPTLDSITDTIATNIPFLADAASIMGKPDAAVFDPAPSSKPAPSAPPANTPAANTPAPSTGAASFDRVINSLANIPGLADVIVASPSPSAPPAPESKPGAPEEGDTAPDLTRLVGKEDNSYMTVLSSWTAQEEADTESSVEEDDAVDRKDGLTQEDPASNSTSSSQPSHVIPDPLAPPPKGTGSKVAKPERQKIPRAATIRVSRKKGARPSPVQSAVVRASWLDMWKGFRHSVYWVTLDGQLMSLWKKRNDRFSELLFHVSSITNVKKQDKGRFSVYFKKKHYDFMAHSEDVGEGWVTSLQACRGQRCPAPSELHGPITIKDPRSRAYAAVWGHDLWIYQNKDNFQLGVATFAIPLNIASVKSMGKHSLSLITPYKTLNLSLDSSKDLSVWLESLSSTIQSALCCSQVTQRLWKNPHNKVCADCGAANPDWASINLLLVICHECAGHHRALSSNLSKVRSLTMDTKAWTEPLLQLFVGYGNQLANQVWAPAVPVREQLRPEATDEERSKFIQDKYSRGRYRRAHPLSSSPSMMEQRLLQVVCSDDVEETMSLICSGVKVCPSDPQSPSPILLAERANQPLQTELLRINEYTEVPPHQPKPARNRLDSNRSCDEEEEELHGKLEDDRFLFSLENDSAACDVLDLREVHSVFLRDGPSQEFELVTPSCPLICNADDREGLLEHLSHILKVILPGGVSYAEVGGASAVSKVFVVGVGGASQHSDAWALLWEDEVSIHPIHRGSQETKRIQLSMLSRHEMDPSENIVSLATADRNVLLRFEDLYSCKTWFQHLEKALVDRKTAPKHPPAANQKTAPPRPPAPNQSSSRQSLYPVIDVGFRGSVPPAIERCISHITAFGLKVEGIYRRCGIASKVNRIVEALETSPNTAPLEGDEQGVLDASSALKQYVRQQESLVSVEHRQQWINAAVISDEQERFKKYRWLLRQLPDDNRATLNALFGHFYMIHFFSEENKMSAHNLAVVLVPSLFQALNQDLIKLTKEFIIHSALLFLTPELDQKE
uniref:Arf-GAP with Rho-GAP domain, ANK repeat and PH domain-containing protein 1-like n=1 Tax=Salarias fasciatus TaxID=181472 RepID=A0A672FAI8_SALFA